MGHKERLQRRSWPCMTILPTRVGIGRIPKRQSERPQWRQHAPQLLWLRNNFRKKEHQRELNLRGKRIFFTFFLV